MAAVILLYRTKSPSTYKGHSFHGAYIIVGQIMDG